MGNHTPGPWLYDRDTEIIHQPKGLSADIAVVHGSFRPNEEREANARLIVAAPDLLSALQALGVKPDGYCFCLNEVQVAQGHTGECRDACATIARADGREVIRG